VSWTDFRVYIIECDYITGFPLRGSSCQKASPMRETQQEAVSEAKARRWVVGVLPDDKDYCPQHSYMADEPEVKP
jgi:hypothetical protein